MSRKKKENPYSKVRIVVDRECDIAMAIKKGYWPCNQDCKRCICCIETTDLGSREHHSEE